MITTRSVRKLVLPGCWDVGVFKSIGSPRPFDTLAASAAEDVDEEGARSSRKPEPELDERSRKLNAAGRTLAAFHAAMGRTEGCGGCWRSTGKHTPQCQARRREWEQRTQEEEPVRFTGPASTRAGDELPAANAAGRNDRLGARTTGVADEATGRAEGATVEEESRAAAHAASSDSNLAAAHSISICISISSSNSLDSGDGSLNDKSFDRT